MRVRSSFLAAFRACKVAIEDWPGGPGDGEGMTCMFL